MKQILKKIELTTKQQFEILNITEAVREAVVESGIQTGMVTVQTPHTTASIRLNHFEPMLLQDILKAMFRLVPQDINYSHDVFELREHVAVNERSNGHAHVKAFVLGSSEHVPVEQGQLLLGERQSILFVELDGGRKRSFTVHIIGE